MKRLVVGLILTCTMTVFATDPTETLTREPDAALAKSKAKAKPATSVETIKPAETVEVTPQPVATDVHKPIEEGPVTEYSRWAVGGELLGAGLLYQAFASFRPHHMFAVNAGVSSFSLLITNFSGPNTKVSFLNFPISASLLLGNIKHSFELLAGGLVSFVSGTPASNTSIAAKASGGGVFPTFGAGYRLWLTKKGFFFRATAYGFLIGGDFFPSGGATFGFAF